MIRTEASFHEGLSTGLFQKGPLGQQPIHFISRRILDTEKRYSQTEKDALAVKWAVTRPRNYLIENTQIHYNNSSQTFDTNVQESQS